MDSRQRLAAGTTTAHSVLPVPAELPPKLATSEAYIGYLNIAQNIARKKPDLRTEARSYMRSQVKALTGKDVDPDHTWLHRFDNASSNGQAYSGWRHIGKPINSQTLTDLALNNFTVEDESASPGSLDEFNGFYTDGPDSTNVYDVRNELPLLPSTLMKRDWAVDFYTQYKSKMDAFSEKHRADYRTMLKGQFIADARKQLQERSTTWRSSDYNLVMSQATQGTLPHLKYNSGWNGKIPMTPLTLSQLKAENPAKGTVHRFDIYGYPSTDILRFYDPKSKNGNTRQILYIPGGQPAFIGFNDVNALNQWVVDQAKDPEKRSTLASHFSLYDRQDGTSFSGVDSALKGLADNPRSWVPRNYINMRNEAINQDIFTQMGKQIEERQSNDANTLIKSNGELNKDLWIRDIEAGEQVLLPLVPIGWPIGLATAAGGAVLVGMGIDKAINGDTQSDRKKGAWTALNGTLDILFSAGGASGEEPVEDPSVSAHTAMNPLSPSKARGVDFNGRRYFVADHPDQPDGYYLLWMQDQNDLSKLVSSGIIAKPNEAGVWLKKGVSGGMNPVPGTSDGGMSKETKAAALENELNTLEKYNPNAARAKNDVLNNSSIEDGGYIDTEVQYGENPIDGYGQFAAQYTKDEWTFGTLTRGKDLPYYVNDVTREQYRVISNKDGFFGELPKRLTHSHIVNEDTLNTMLPLKQDAEALTIFLTSTSNGRSMARVMKDFGLEPTGIEVTKNLSHYSEDVESVDITVSVEPETNNIGSESDAVPPRPL
jgi:hypothetical protein